jgi:hypothetical protein
MTKNPKVGPLLIFYISLGLTLKSILVDRGNPVHAQVHPPGAQGRKHPLLEKDGDCIELNDWYDFSLGAICSSSICSAKSSPTSQSTGSENRTRDLLFWVLYIKAKIRPNLYNIRQ